ncbi:hypothetical protein INR49_001046 [Caranx melampygus]|nr:hypothetical protein INR49_001046 [Caranx melampygus]
MWLRGSESTLSLPHYEALPSVSLSARLPEPLLRSVHRVTLKANNEQVCLDPEAPMGKQLTRCWNRAHKLGRDVTLCLRRRRAKGRGRGGQRRRSRLRIGGQHAKASSSNSQ